MKTVCVLMSTYNGEKYLRVQIESILANKNVKVQLLVRDDGSTDETLSILREYAEQKKLIYYTGPNLKPAYSFLDLIQHATRADYYAFSDQDDYWFPGKLYRAVTQLEKFTQTPSLYHARPQIVDEQLRPLSGRMARYICTSFAQSVVGIFAVGCTMVFNNKLCDLLKLYTPSYLLMHDSWAFQVCVAVGGNVIYDSEPSIYYRQHANNVLGAKANFKKRWQRRVANFTRSYSGLIEEIMNGYKEYLPSENLSICQRVLDYKKGWQYKWRLLTDISIRTGNKHMDRLYILKVLLGLF